MTVEQAIALERQRLERTLGTQHKQSGQWRRPVERPFTKAERERTTVLFGGLTWKHERLIQANLHRLGYKSEFLQAPDNRAFEKGKEFSNNGLCNPTYFTVGNLIAYLLDLEAKGMSRSEIIDSYVFFTAGACGPCRFGMYESEYRLSLRNAGFEGFRILILQQHGGLDQASDDAGLEMNIDFTLGIINAFFIADVLNDFAYRIRPYELVEGETDRALAMAIAHVAKSIERMPVIQLPTKLNFLLRPGRLDRKFESIAKFLAQLFSPRLLKLLRQCRTYFEHIEVDRTRIRPVVKITGEFWAQTTEGDGNFRMFRFLEQEGAEVLIEQITPWLTYLLHQEKQAHRDRKYLDVSAAASLPRRVLAAIAVRLRYARKLCVLTLAERLYAREYERYRRVFEGIPQAMPDQYHFQRIAHPYFNSRIEGGEGHLEVAKTIYYSRERLAHMILSLKPFGCLPSTQSDGVQSSVIAHHPDIVFLPVETSGEGEVNAQSRVQMTLNDARQSARDEFNRVLDETGMSREEFTRIVQADAELRSPFLRLPEASRVVGTAARTAWLLAKRRITKRKLP